MFGALVKMAKGVDIGAHGNGVSCVPCVGASPSLLLRGVLWKVSLCLGILSFSHVLQPSADVKFGSVFSGETESKGHVSACSELESVELGGFVHTHSETFSVNGTHLIGLFSYSLVAGANSLGLGLPCVFVPLGDWWMLVARVHLSRSRALSSSLLLMYVEEEGAQESSLTMAKGCVMSSRSWWGDRAAAIVGTFAPVVKSVLPETCAARLGAAKIHGVLALTYARSWVLLHTGMESSLLHIVNVDFGFSGISPVLFVCGPGMKKSVKDVCQRIDVCAFSAPSQVGIAAASAAASRLFFMFSTFCQDASRAAAAWRAGAFVYLFCLEGVFELTCAFGQIVSIVAAAAFGNVFNHVASLAAAAAWFAGVFVYIFCLEGVFVLECVFLKWFLAFCGWLLAFGGHVLGLRIQNLCCVALTQLSCLGGVVCPLIGQSRRMVE